MRNLTFSLMHSVGVPTLLRKQRVRNREISVLVFHRVSDDEDPLWPPMPIGSFRTLIRELSERTHVVQLHERDLLDEHPNRPVVALSFDDGYRDFVEHALPILKEYGLPAHHNVCPELIDAGTPPWTQYLNVYLQRHRGTVTLPNGRQLLAGRRCRERDFLRACAEVVQLEEGVRVEWLRWLQEQVDESGMPRLMDWNQVRTCAQAGIHIGSHGMDHADLSQMHDREQLRQQIQGSRQRIKCEVGEVPQIFAFPSGAYGDLALDVVDESGYQVALLCQDKVSRLPGRTSRNGMRILPRITMCRRTWKEEHLRALGLHQKLRSWATHTSYVLHEAKLLEGFLASNDKSSGESVPT